MSKILIIDDEAAICSSLKFAFSDKYTVKTTTDPLEGLNLAKENDFNLVLLDLKLGDVDGIQILEELKKINNNMIIIIMTAYGTIPSSVEALKKGAHTYLTKPLDTNKLLNQIQEALEYQNFSLQFNCSSGVLEEKYEYNGMLGKSNLMKKVFQLIEKVKDVSTNVLITGESGTGKELVAQAIHYSGKRKNGPFEVVNCAAIPENLLESELFGHKKGAFTGALTDKVGKFELANNGSIFLDEIGEMPLQLQSKLLRVLQQKTITPLGGTTPKELDVRVISATNKNLKDEVGTGKFRDDLYYRLNVMEISVPPLRNRREDIPLLIRHFIDKYNQELGKKITGITSEARKQLLQYDFPGNVRELENVIEASMVVTDEDTIDWFHLPGEIISHSDLDISSQSLGGIKDFIGQNLEELEKHFIKLTLEQNEGHKKKTAEMLGLSEKGLRNKIKRYNIETPES